MKVATRLYEQLCTALGELCPPSTLRLTHLELFPGPTPYAPVPALVGHLVVEDRLPDAAELTERLGPILPAGVAMPMLSGEAVTTAALAGMIARLASSLSARSTALELGSGSRSQGDDRALFWVEVADENVALLAASTALMAIGSSLGRKPRSAAMIRNEELLLRERRKSRTPSKESRLMIAAARADKIPVLPVRGSASVWQFGWGACSELFWVTTSNRDGIVAGMISSYKNYQKALFESLGLPTPRWYLLRDDAELAIAIAIRKVGFPCVVKPIDHNSGRGVTANIGNRAVLRRAVAVARRFSAQLMLEAHEPGHDHRLMVVNGRLEMALRLEPPHVTGDGRRSVEALVEALNRERDTDTTSGAPGPVPLDDSLDLALASQGLTRGSVPEADRQVQLRTNANRATGGTAVNVIDQVHPHIRHYAELLAEATGFATAGIDYVTTDISRPHEQVGGGFLEINGTPGMARAIESGIAPPELARLIVGTRPGRIPACLIIAPAEQIGSVADGLAAALRDGDGLLAGRKARLGAIALPDMPRRPVERVSALLRYRTLESLVVIWAEQDLYDWGMPLDLVDMLVVSGSGPREEWQELLQDRAANAVEAEDAATAIRHAEVWLRDRVSKGQRQACN